MHNFWGYKVSRVRILEVSSPPFLTQRAGSKLNEFGSEKQIGFLKNALAVMIGVVLHNPGVESLS